MLCDGAFDLVIKREFHVFVVSALKPQNFAKAPIYRLIMSITHFLCLTGKGTGKRSARVVFDSVVQCGLMR